ncbi:peptide chain release factor N(5)-glutamine methyltransferase [Salinispirillum sp. LH 10-3-1]|uniref:Release factor glutamine methyltransferase n=1 Tax=Salinispirillum sp. LH 10-3-1 TaxID=2952525 RepID=A0AB38YCV2_9GAMM
MNIGTAMQWASSQLSGQEARVDAEHLLCHVLHQPRTYLFTWPDRLLGDAQLALFQQLVAKRQLGEPIAYLTGHRAFWTLDLETAPSTLIPRADTETLVSAVLERVSPSAMDVVDLGTGTGAIALALASERPSWRVQGIDLSADAVALAQRNAQRNELENVTFRQGSWCTPLADHSVDVLVSNPPYIRQDDPHLDEGDVRFEPRSALTSGADGLDDIRTIIQQAKRVLRAGGWIFFEHGYDQRDDVILLLISAGFEGLASEQDLGGNDRVTLGRLPRLITL